MPATRTSSITADHFIDFGALLKYLRHRAGLIQRELALAVGYSTSQISRLEHGERPPEGTLLAARFVVALDLANEPAWAERLLELAANARAGAVPAVPAARHNLPEQWTSFVGREDALPEGDRLLRASRLVTLTGPGGSGKTRLALQLATRALTHFPDGVWLIELAPLADPALVPQAIASVLAVPEQPSRPMLETLKSYLRARKALLILDNCEHLIKACAQLAAAILRASPALHLLTTSREALRDAGEAVLVVPPLLAPDPRNRLALETIRGYESVRLFVDRARSALPNFAITPGNVQAAAAVCFALDGMPLAIELAAARVRFLTVEQIAERLTDRFQLLTGGARTALPRHQTLEALIDWSYDLLSEPERALLRRLAVFADGWTLEAAEQVCGDEPGRISRIAVLALLAGLANKSLIGVDLAGQEARYACLATMRQYALAKLEASGEAEALRQRHAAYYCTLAETAEARLWTAQVRHWLDRLQTELDNFRAALAWMQTAPDSTEAWLRLASGLHQFWEARGSKSEGLGWLEAGLTRAEAGVSGFVRRRALFWAGWLARTSGDYPAAERCFTASLRISQQVGDRSGQGWAILGLSYLAWNRREDDRAVAAGAESLAIFRELGEKLGIAQSRDCLGRAARAVGDYEVARANYAECLKLWQEAGYLNGICGALTELGHLARAQGQDDQAAAFYDQSLQLAKELDASSVIAELLYCQAQLAHNQGANDRAKRLLIESLVICRDFDNRVIGAFSLAGFGGALTAQGQPDAGARLLSAAAAAFGAIGKRMTVSMQAEFDRDLNAARAQLDEATFASAWAEGQAMTREQAIELALSP